MPLPRKKPAAAPGNKAAPQFTVVGKDAPPPKAGGLNFGGLAKTAEKKTKGTTHPALVLAGEGLELLGQYAEHAPKFKELEKLVGSKGSIKAQLRPHLVEAYFRYYAGRAIDDARCNTATAKDVPVKLTFKDQYSRMCTNLQQLLIAVPAVAEHVHVVNKLTIEFDKIPAEKQQPLVDALIEAAQKLEITEGISAGDCVQPKPGFHAQRCILLSPEENIALDQILPITAYPQL